MEFRNLTPLDAIAFKAVDGAKNEFNVVTLKAASARTFPRTSCFKALTH
ncbi:hypothetical protein SBC1_47580 (plasmid) [Caballeronia sp. SBC1]|nr:hypothetical protein SBC2_40390 [Caballeronia sp. SBC2]QIN64718.1 hypothetical protein SBC1_47580 [Caballeronia sp. SBC1]